MATIKRASVKAIEYGSKLAGKELSKTTTWEQVADIILEGFEWDLLTHTKTQGDNTIVRLYRVSEGDGRDNLIKTWSIPNSEVFYEKDGDWDWAFLYKMLSEFLIKNRKNILTGKPIKEDIKNVSITPEQSIKPSDIQELKAAIKKATGKEKKKLIQEYNRKSLAIQKPGTSSLNQPVMDIQKLREIKNSLYHKVRHMKSKGKDTTELEKQLAEVYQQIEQTKKISQ